MSCLLQGSPRGQSYAKAFDCVDHSKLWKILKEMGIPDHLTCLLSGCLGLSNLQIQAWGQTLGTNPRSEGPLSSASISWHVCLQVAGRMPSHGPLIFILHQYLVLGRWLLLTSGIQRRKNLIHVMCGPAPDCLRVIQDTFLIEHTLSGLQCCRTQMVFERLRERIARWPREKSY